MRRFLRLVMLDFDFPPGNKLPKEAMVLLPALPSSVRCVRNSGHSARSGCATLFPFG